MTTEQSKRGASQTQRRERDTTDSSANRVMKTMWWKWMMGLLMLYVIYGAFFIAKGAQGFQNNGDVARIVFFHVPVAILCSLWFFVGAIYAGMVLAKKRDSDKQWQQKDIKSSIAMELGFLASILATITGSIFARAEWNSYWNWDPREVSIVGLLLIYASYLVLRGAVSANPIRRAQLSAVYAIVTLIPATFLVWVVPRIPALQTLHPVTVLTDANSSSASYKLVGITSFIAFTLLFVWLFQLRFRVYKLAERRQVRLQG